MSNGFSKVFLALIFAIKKNTNLAPSFRLVKAMAARMPECDQIFELVKLALAYVPRKDVGQLCLEVVDCYAKAEGSMVFFGNMMALAVA
mmetsp:Transcript_17486/g.26953  ORF Transcript_17486/g.26953 Transcript_17486/m.26953 type:complete len:89 (+) Transcript_17486:1684-1950(+)